jgi:hypothetical protein
MSAPNRMTDMKVVSITCPLVTDTVDKLVVGPIFDVCFLWQRPFIFRRGLLPGRFLALGWWFFRFAMAFRLVWGWAEAVWS